MGIPVRVGSWAPFLRINFMKNSYLDEQMKLIPKQKQKEVIKKTNKIIKQNRKNIKKNVI